MVVRTHSFPLQSICREIHGFEKQADSFAFGSRIHWVFRSRFGARFLRANRPEIEILNDRLFKYRVDFEHLQVDDKVGAICFSRPTNLRETW